MAVTQTTSVIKSAVGSTPKITHLSMPLANTEYSHSFTTGTTQFLFRNQTGNTIKYAYTVGESGTKYITLQGCATREVTRITTGSVTLYVQSAVAGQLLEIEEWF